MYNPVTIKNSINILSIPDRSQRGFSRLEKKGRISRRISTALLDKDKRELIEISQFLKLRKYKMDNVVDRIIPIIVQEINPEKIILFGSRARGEAGKDSDVDLLIVYDGELSKREVKLKIHRLFSQRDFSMDIFVLNSGEFERQKNIVSTVGRVAAREGVVCYG